MQRPERAITAPASRFARTRKGTARARRLRRDLTDAERKLWSGLRRSHINGLSFRRQHAVGPYVLDFYCPAIRLAIELDGGQHNEEAGQARDARRAEWLGSKGIRVVRFWNNDVLENLDGVLEEIARITEAQHSRRATPSLTLPLSGGGDDDGEV